MKVVCFVLAIMLFFVSSIRVSAHGWLPSDAAKENFSGGDGLCWRVDFTDGWPKLNRPGRYLPLDVYRGAVEDVFSVALGGGPPPKPAIKKETWDCIRAEYHLKSGAAILTVNRLSPAVLFEMSGRSVTFRAKAGPKYIAFVRKGTPTVHRIDVPTSLQSDILSLSEPWMLVWFGDKSSFKAHLQPHDVEGVLGVSKTSLGFAREPDTVDLPILFRLEQAPASIRSTSEGRLALAFERPAGKMAVMPLDGGRLFLPDETEKWSEGLPAEILRRCRAWSVRLRDFPLSVGEDFKVDSQTGTVTIENDFQWISFKDDWNSPPIKAAPIPPMLATALRGEAPVRLVANNREVKPADCEFMDMAGIMTVIEGVDDYTYRISEIEDLLDVPHLSGNIDDSRARSLQEKLEKHVEQMVEAGPLAPLLYIYGGIGGTWFSHFYWGAGSDPAVALAASYPYLSGKLQEKTLIYLESEWKANPPFEFNRSRYTSGRPRTPYEIPWEDMTRQLDYALKREKEYRQSDHLFELYGFDAYLRLTRREPPQELRSKARDMATEMLGRQDWALMGPARFRTVRDRHAVFYYNLQGSATYNRWLAGAIGLTRMARRYGWENEEKIGCYLTAKLAVARIGQARYVSQMHRYGLVRGRAEDDNRALLHIDTKCAVVGRGPLEVGVHQNQELPPFNDLTEEVGGWLGKYARAECRIYLDHLDYSLPLWYISEAPKQQATEHRTSPLQNYSGNVLAQRWILDKQGDEFAHYIDTTRFIGDLYYIRNLTTGVRCYGQE